MTIATESSPGLWVSRLLALTREGKIRWTAEAAERFTASAEGVRIVVEYKTPPETIDRLHRLLRGEMVDRAYYEMAVKDPNGRDIYFLKDFAGLERLYEAAKSQSFSEANEFMQDFFDSVERKAGVGSR